MMGLDSNIALQGKLPQFENPLAQFAQVSAIQNAQNQNQLAQYTISKAQRGDADELAIRNLLTGAGGDLEAGKNALYKGGFYKQAQEMGKSQLEQDKAKSEIGKNNAAAGKSNQETSAAKRAQAIQDMASFETPADALASLQHHAQQGSIDPQQAQLMAKNIPTDPAQFAQWQVGMLRKLMAPKDQVALTTPDANAQLSARTSLANNSATVGATVRGQDISQGTAIRGQDITVRGQDKTDSRTREFNSTKVEENNLKREQKEETANLTKSSQLASFDTMLGTLDRLGAHPGLSSSVGITGAFPTMPGSNSANFQAELNSFQSQAFIPMVAQLKGMGALSDAEGKKLTAAVGALDPKMGETAFRESVTRITDDMKAAKARMVGGGKKDATPAAQVKDAIDNGEVKKLVDARPVSVKNAADYAKLPPGTVYTAPDGSMRTKS